ncbi:hypothetical protein Tco_0000318 [Tanacetum coccineum]
MTTLVIDLTKSQSDSPLPTSTTTISTITTTTTTLPPPPPQPQQSIADLILVKRIGEFEQHMADLIQNNLALEERLDKQGSQLYNLENLNIPHKVIQAVDEIVTDAVDWAMQAPLRARFRDLPTIDMKEILQQRMFEDNSYKAHDVHNDLYEALQKSLELDYSNQRLADQEEARKKRRKRRDQQGSNAPSSSKTAALASQSMAWTTSDTRYESVGVSRAQELSPIDSLMHEDSIPDEQVHLSDDEDFGNDHLPKADSQKDWWKPLPKEERPATLELSWIIPSSNVSYVENNWASALVSTSKTAAENSLLAKTRDMTTFMKCDGTLTRVLEALDYRVKEFKVMRLNPGMNTRFWTQKDVTMSKEFIADIEKRPKTRRIYWNLECFVGGRVRDIDYRLLQRTE